jgi:hypothetical protein
VRSDAATNGAKRARYEEVVKSLRHRCRGLSRPNVVVNSRPESDASFVIVLKANLPFGLVLIQILTSPPRVERSIPWREKLPLQASQTSPLQVYSKMVDIALFFSRFSSGIQFEIKNYRVLDHDVEHVA